MTRKKSSLEKKPLTNDQIQLIQYEEEKNFYSKNKLIFYCSTIFLSMLHNLDDFTKLTEKYIDNDLTSFLSHVLMTVSMIGFSNSLAENIVAKQNKIQQKEVFNEADLYKLKLLSKYLVGLSYLVGISAIEYTFSPEDLTAISLEDNQLILASLIYLINIVFEAKKNIK